MERGRSAIGHASRGVAAWLLALIVATSAQAAPAPQPGLRVTGDEAAAREYFAAWERLNQLRTYRQRMSMGTQGSMVIEVVNPNRRRTTMEQGNARFETLLVGNEFRMRQGNGPYQCPPPQMRQQIGGPDPDPKNAQGEINVTRLPDATIDGAAVRGYLLATTANGVTVRMRGWVLGSGEVRRVEMLNAAGSVEATIDFYDFNAPITIPDPPPCP